jgi:hypothetical protein
MKMSIQSGIIKVFSPKFHALAEEFLSLQLVVWHFKVSFVALYDSSFGS